MATIRTLSTNTSGAVVVRPRLVKFVLNVTPFTVKLRTCHALLLRSCGDNR